MRKIEFNELKLKNTYDENSFYQYYLKNIQKDLKQQKFLKMPEKKYEIFYLNILGGKIILLNKEYIADSNADNKELFYDYKTAYQIYNYFLDIYDGIEDEKNEFNELYKEERLEKDKNINKLKLKDEELFNNAVKEYIAVKNSPLYYEYIKLIMENKELKTINAELTKKINSNHNQNVGFIQKIINKFRMKKLLNNGEK